MGGWQAELIKGLSLYIAKGRSGNVVAITGRRPSTYSFTRRPLIAATIHSKTISENPGGFFGAGES